jgi:exonuclease SbcD
MFFDWLIETIVKESVDVLLISGDIFDLANPAVKDRKLYFNFLSQLIKYNIKVIITGGNHDAIGLINAPQTILNELNITVIGGATENIEDEIVPVTNKNAEIELVVAAVPFLRDKDLRKKDSEIKYKNRIEAIREGIKDHYAQLAAITERKYPNLPCIAMGHLYASGSTTSDSERDIHIGNQAAISSTIFSEAFDYVALGHIHKPQIIGGNENIRYSGSPIALSFSERTDKKCVIILDIENGHINAPRVLDIPKNRSLVKIKGTKEDVKSKLEAYVNEHTLPSFIEIEINEDSYNPLLISEMDQLISDYEQNASFKILKSRIIFKEGAKDTSDLFTKGTRIEDIAPKDVFAKLLEQQELESETIDLLKEAFDEIVNETLESGTL